MQNEYITKHNNIVAEKVIQKLQSRYFEAYYVKTKEEALNKALKLIPKSDIVSWGGSTSAVEIGLIDYVINNGYQVINRDNAKTAEERTELLRNALLCDTYIMGTNALTSDGELVNIDCIGNRTAALMFGPKKVIVIAGINKVCGTLEDAIKRARNYAAPVNMQRISEKSGKQTPCIKTGECLNCRSKDSICSHIVVTRLCNPENRIKIILTGEPLGF